MERLTKLLLAVLIIGVLAELMLGPGILIFCGLMILVIMWAATGGLASGNPYKRMANSPYPDFIEAKDYMRNFEIENRDKGNLADTLFVYGIGLLLMAIDILYMWYLGWL